MTCVIYEELDGVARITLNRPTRLNAINTVLAEELRRALERALASSATGAIILAAAGRAFCAGDDLAELAKGEIDAEGAEYDILLEARPETLARVRHIAVEYHVGVNEHRPEELESRLEGLGFEVTRFPPLDVAGGHLHASRR